MQMFQNSMPCQLARLWLFLLTVAGHTAETVTSVKPARDDFKTVTRKKQGDN